jgi:hypothetical protein
MSPVLANATKQSHRLSRAIRVLSGCDCFAALARTGGVLCHLPAVEKADEPLRFQSLLLVVGYHHEGSALVAI